jgi:hypothetical protein
MYAAAAGSALALSTLAMADIIHNPDGPHTTVSATGNSWAMSRSRVDGSRGRPAESTCQCQCHVPC